jgi:hypothetical protein
MDALLWILVGLAGGMALAALAPQPREPSRSATGRRYVRAGAAGMAGALAAGYALVLFDPALRTEGLTTMIGSLAGSLWLAAAAEAYASRWRPDETSASAAGASEPNGARPAVDAPAYDATRHALAAGLLEDAAAHDAGRYEELGRQIPSIGDSVSRQDPSRSLQLQLALRFWRGWIVARDGRWPNGEPANDMALSDWPRFARVIASDLALDRSTRDPAIVARFT